MTNLTYVRAPGHWASDFSGSAVTVNSGSNATPLTFGTSNWTIEFFVYNYNGIGAPAQTLLDFRSSADGAYPTIYKNSAGVIIYRANTGDRITGTTALQKNQWYHVAVCRTSSVTRLFINGTKEGSDYADTTSYLLGSTRPYIGYPSNSNTGIAFSGAISNLRILKNEGLYAANFTAPSSPLTATANTVLLTCNNSTLTDASSSAYTISAQAGSQISYIPGPFSNYDSNVLVSSNLMEIDTAPNNNYFSSDPQSYRNVLSLTTEKYGNPSNSLTKIDTEPNNNYFSSDPQSYRSAKFIIQQGGASDIKQYWS